MSNSKRVIFYAPIGNLVSSYKSGGAEAGCRKTIEVLTKNGYEIILVEKPAKHKDNIIGLLLLILKLVFVWFRLIYLFVKIPNAKFHLVGFYLKQLPIEYFFMKTAKKFSMTTIYEIRNGGMIETFNEGTGSYQKQMLAILDAADGILCQGQEYVCFIKERLRKSATYYPNYILSRFSSGNIKVRSSNLVRLVYLGRVVEDKNIAFILDICKNLDERKIHFQLDIIGGYEDNYYKHLNTYIYDLALNPSNKIIFHGRLDGDAMFSILEEQHYFLFPTKEKREGHSNSLTETMALGILPIASSIGFNASIINDDKLIVRDFTPALYADVIIEIEQSNLFNFYSQKVQKRIMDNFTEDIVKEALIDFYNTLEK